MILQNDFHTEHRKRRWEAEDSEGAYAARLISLPDQQFRLELQDLSEALSKLPTWQRELLLLVGAEGMSYEEIAARQHVTVGPSRAGSTGRATTSRTSLVCGLKVPSAHGS
jgi:RNA polymerase sigma-70 factor (ECF subfamily)